MNYVDFVPRIFELMETDLSVTAFMQELTRAHAAAYPHFDWTALLAMSFDEIEDLAKDWLVPAFTREPPRAKRVKALWCGLHNPRLSSGETAADMSIGGSKNFVPNEVPRQWNTELEYSPLQRNANSRVSLGLRPRSRRVVRPYPRFARVAASNSRVLTGLYRGAYGPKNGPGNAAELYLGVGYAAKAIATLLDRVDPSLVLGTRKSVEVAVGWNSGDAYYIGHLSRDRFVPRPASEAIAAIEDEKRRRNEREEAHIRAEQTFRRFRHPDGRRWAINVTTYQIVLEFTDRDGDEHRRTQFAKWVTDDMSAIAQELIAEQVAAGFIEVSS